MGPVRVRAQARRLIWLAPAAIALSVAPSGSARLQSPALSNPTLAPVPASYFSMNILFHPLNRVPWPAVPIGGWRTAHVFWADIEPQPNHWYFDLLDKYVSWSQAHQTPILMQLAYTPRWASSTPDAPTDVEATNPPGLSGAPRNMEDWRTYVKTVATRYKGRIHNWEIWNEPNRPQSWTGSVDTLVEMTHEASAILKQIDPANIVVSPAPTETRGLAYLDAFLTKGGGKYVDVIGYHFYVGREPPEAMVTLIGGVEKVLAKHGLESMPLWSTEAGWLGSDLLPPDVQAAYLARAYILSWASGVSRFYWYAWENHHGTRIELVGPDNATLTPAGKAFGTIQNWMTGAVLAGCRLAKNGVWICGLERGNRTSHLVWSAGGETPFPVPAAWGAQEVDSLDGDRAPIPGNAISAGNSPVLIQ
ncbi:MAG: glycosyl hydrolase [Terracidiphilus sp.]